MSNYPKIAILLSTYNGAQFLEEQLDSLLQQTYSDLVIVARDDGSLDNSQRILENYALRHQEKIHQVTNSDVNLGASGSFSFLIEYVLEEKETLGLTSAYMMFCDQDDVWFPDKVNKQVSAMLVAEQKIFSQPILIHSDLHVVSASNQLIAKSFIQYQGLEIERSRFTNMVIRNLVTGCTALINEELARKAIPIPTKAIMHDWWLALVASSLGEVIFLNTPLVSYRQHGCNTIGAKEFTKLPVNSASFLRRFFSKEVNQHLFQVAMQAKEFRKRFGKKLNAKDNICLLASSFMSINIAPLQRLFYRIARMFN